MTKNRRHRPRNTERIESMQRWYEVALEDARKTESGFYDDMHEDMPSDANMTNEKWFDLVMQCMKNNGETNSFSRSDADALEWVKSFQDREGLFTTPRSDKMLAYRIAAALFNHSLAHAQSLGTRKNEKPITASGLERALNRRKTKKTSVE